MWLCTKWFEVGETTAEGIQEMKVEAWNHVFEGVRFKSMLSSNTTTQILYYQTWVATRTCHALWTVGPSFAKYSQTHREANQIAPNLFLTIKRNYSAGSTTISCLSDLIWEVWVETLIACLERYPYCCDLKILHVVPTKTSSFICLRNAQYLSANVLPYDLVSDLSVFILDILETFRPNTIVIGSPNLSCVTFPRAWNIGKVY